MNRRPARCIALLMAVMAAGPLAAAPIEPFRATYEVRRNGDVLGEATLRLERAGADWRFSTETRGTQGLAKIAGVRIDESSQFRYVDGRPETLRYDYRQKTGFNERARSAEVDARGGRVTLRNRNDRHEVPYVAGVVDRQLVTVALMQAMASGQRGVRQLQVAGRHAIETQDWAFGATETVAGLGERGIRIERRREGDEGRSTTLWLDVDQGHLPLRIEQREDDGETIEMRLLRRG